MLSDLFPPTASAATRKRVSAADVEKTADALLRAGERPTIERIPGVDAVSPFTWFGGHFKNEESMTWAQFAMDPTKLRAIFDDAKMPEERFAAFEKDQRGCVIGKLSADKYKLKVGDRITLTSMIYPVSLDFNISGIYSGTIDDRNMLFHHKYFDEATGDLGQVGMWWVKVHSAEDMPRVLKAINEAFANTSAEVRAESERAFQLSFISMWGNIKLMVGSICTVVVFSLVLVSASTMSMAIRERFRELAVLKALGFRRRELFAFILAESFGLAALGALLGVGGAYMLFTYADVPAMTNGIFLTFEVTPKIIGISSSVAAGLGIIACIAPCLSVARTSVVQGLKTLD